MYKVNKIKYLNYQYYVFFTNFYGQRTLQIEMYRRKKNNKEIKHVYRFFASFVTLFKSIRNGYIHLDET